MKAMALMMVMTLAGRALSERQRLPPPLAQVLAGRVALCWLRRLGLMLLPPLLPLLVVEWGLGSWQTQAPCGMALHSMPAANPRVAATPRMPPGADPVLVRLPPGQAHHQQ